MKKIPKYRTDYNPPVIEAPFFTDFRDNIQLDYPTIDEQLLYSLRRIFPSLEIEKSTSRLYRMIRTRARGETVNRIISIKPRLSIHDIFTEELSMDSVEMKTSMNKYLSDPV